ncbi:cell surface protein [Lacticaseibacillus chiayiensis]|nr:cell surface protein [Lacticaseibacillus chiayiensis]
MTKKNRSLWCLAFGLIAVLIGFSPQQTLAADDAGFTVKTVLPVNQRDSSQTYFDLRVSPNQEQDLEVVIQNRNTTALTVLIAAHSAFTNDNGVVEYGKSPKPADPSLSVNLKDVVSVPAEVTIPALNQRVVKIHLKMPSKPFLGTVLGGLQFKAKPDDKWTEKGAVTNRYVYAVGLMLTESDQPVGPDLKLQKVVTANDHRRPAILAQVQNFEAAILRNLQVQGYLYRASGGKVIHQAEQDRINMAPNSNFNFKMGLEKTPLKPGKYRLELMAKGSGRTWKLKQVFTVSKQAANQISTLAKPEPPKQALPWYLFLGGGIVIGIVSYAGLKKILAQRQHPR